MIGTRKELKSRQNTKSMTCNTENKQTNKQINVDVLKKILILNTAYWIKPGHMAKINKDY